MSALARGDRRLEGETYLCSGYGTRQAIERKKGWVRFGEVAKAWMPSRIKQVFVSKEFGVPYLNTSQVFDIRPSPRKWLSAGKTTHADERMARCGTILVMRSASPGRSTLVTAAHEGAFLSDHFMRVDPIDSMNAGWIYAFLKSAQGLALMRGSQYASIIRHIEPNHLLALPIPTVSAKIAAGFNESVTRLLELRNKSFKLAEEADQCFARQVGVPVLVEKEEGFSVKASSLFTGRRRFEASFHTPVAAAILARFKKFDRLRDVTERVWWMSRMKRYFGDQGIPYISASDLFSTSRLETQRVLVSHDDKHEDYFVQPGWILMARSGQVYGLNGAATITTEGHKNVYFSDDFIRIIPRKSAIPSGYLLVALTHRILGRPLLIRAAYGTSIPHLDPADVADFPVVRLTKDREQEISDLAEASAKARVDAETLEQQIAVEAEAIIDRFLAE